LARTSDGGGEFVGIASRDQIRHYYLSKNYEVESRGRFGRGANEERRSLTHCTSGCFHPIKSPFVVRVAMGVYAEFRGRSSRPTYAAGSLLIASLRNFPVRVGVGAVGVGANVCPARAGFASSNATLRLRRSMGSGTGGAAMVEASRGRASRSAWKKRVEAGLEMRISDFESRASRVFSSERFKGARDQR
jgi:hypothetical protein